MARGRNAAVLTLSEPEREEVEQWARRPTSAYGTLPPLEALVGGLIQCVSPTLIYDLWVNEEGLLIGLQPNRAHLCGPNVVTRTNDAGATIGLDDLDIHRQGNTRRDTGDLTVVGALGRSYGPDAVRYPARGASHAQHSPTSTDRREPTSHNGIQQRRYLGVRSHEHWSAGSAQSHRNF